jgi:ubiquitin-protein ligase
MATPIYVMRLSRDYKSIQGSPIPYIETHPSPTNILHWSFVITGPPSTPYSEGQYYGHLIFPSSFPYAAPKIRLITPSGRFLPNINICTTFTSMHPEEWNPAWTVESILTGFLSFMTSEEEAGGTVFPRTTDEERKLFARNSKKWNSLEWDSFREDFPVLHISNVANERFSDAERKVLEGFEVSIPEDTDCGDRLMDTSFESHTNENWEQFGSMNDDFDYYDDDEYETSETELDGEEKED